MSETMIEIIARGEVEITEFEHTERGQTDGANNGHSTAFEVTRTAEAEVHHEFSEGHVNLEGYMPPAMDMTPAQLFGEELPDEVGDARPIEGTWSWSAHGGEEDWLLAAEVWITERPHMGKTDALYWFRDYLPDPPRGLVRAIEAAQPDAPNPMPGYRETKVSETTIRWDLKDTPDGAHCYAVAKREGPDAHHWEVYGRCTTEDGDVTTAFSATRPHRDDAEVALTEAAEAAAEEFGRYRTH